MTEEFRTVMVDPNNRSAVAAGERIEAANAAERQPDRLVLVEIWRIPRGFFWREWLPTNPPSQPSAWRRMASGYARKVLNMPNSFYTDDAFPGVTFCVRRADDGKMTGADWDAVRKL